MKRLGKFLLYLTVFLVLVLFFAPKRQLYYFGESKLAPYGVVLSGEYVDDGGLSLSLKDGTLYYQDLEVAKLPEVTVLPLLVFNAVTVAPFSFSEQMQGFVPGTVDGIRVRQSLLDPLHVLVDASGDFGTLEGNIDLGARRVSLLLTPSKRLLESKSFWLKELKKQQSGGYLYESAF